jgi:DNA-binding transcriptional regulator YiaG
MIQYRGCGLDNVFLRNGYRLGRTDAGTETLYIENVTELHRAVAEWVCDLQRALTPKEFKFLRKELDLSQRQLGEFLRVKEGTVSTWERGTFPIDALADVVLRTLVKERISGNAAFEAVLQRLAHHECAQLWEDATRIEFEATPEWRHAA